jgi:hypothetical protein
MSSKKESSGPSAYGARKTLPAILPIKFYCARREIEFVTSLLDGTLYCKDPENLFTSHIFLDFPERPQNRASLLNAILRGRSPMIDLSLYDEDDSFDDSFDLDTKYVPHSTVHNGIYYFEAQMCVENGCAKDGFPCQSDRLHPRNTPFARFIGEGEAPTDWLEKLDLIIRFKQHDEFFAQFLPDDEE